MFSALILRSPNEVRASRRMAAHSEFAAMVRDARFVRSSP
jgi:hypothetical protein